MHKLINKYCGKLYCDIYFSGAYVFQFNRNNENNNEKKRSNVFFISIIH